jgi:hypothetical protein
LTSVSIIDSAFSSFSRSIDFSNALEKSESAIGAVSSAYPSFFSNSYWFLESSEELDVLSTGATSYYFDEVSTFSCSDLGFSYSLTFMVPAIPPEIELPTFAKADTSSFPMNFPF